ncbi:MAG: DUF4176 domain-containing protein [Lachnospiraceae bacterium]|nr:DUF4176 domain-containing protein [Lachnospiraceae bacterium]
MRELLPVGSVVRLKNAVRKAVIMGCMQQVTRGEGKGKAPEVYDYMAVPFPEGYLGKGTVFLFNEEDIEEVCFTGYENSESKGYMELIGTVFDAAQKGAGERTGTE